MNPTNVLETKTGNIMSQNLKRGETTLRLSKKPKCLEKAVIGSAQEKLKDSLLLTREMAAQRLGCHWQTLLCREKKGQLNPIKIGKRKFYSVGQIDLLKKTNPVHNKPHWTKSLTKIQTRPTLWNRIIAFFVR